MAVSRWNETYPIGPVLDRLNQAYPYHPMGDVTRRDPFKVLICCLLTLQSKDTVTMPVCFALFQHVHTPEQLLAVPEGTLRTLLSPVRFYDSKIITLRKVCQELIDRFGGRVPDTLEALDSLPGVGIKTANLVLQLGFNQPAICVDTHVHRICNRLGYVRTGTPDDTAEVLRQILPLQYWNVINRVMVRHGQELCVASHPACDLCPVNTYCQKVDVTPRAGRSPRKPVHPVFRPETWQAKMALK